MALTSAISPVLIYYGYKFIRSYQTGRLLYSTAGANQKIQSIYKLYFFCSNLLVFDLQFCGSTLILWLQDGVTTWTKEEIIVVSIGTVVTILWMATGLLAVKFRILIKFQLQCIARQQIN
jgi:hypothetical protein